MNVIIKEYESIFCNKLLSTDIINNILSYLLGYEFLGQEYMCCVVCYNKSIKNINSLSDFFEYSKYLYEIDNGMVDIIGITKFSFNCIKFNSGFICNNKTKKEFVDTTVCRICKYYLLDPFFFIPDGSLFLMKFNKITTKIILLKHINLQIKIDIYIVALCIAYYLFMIFDILRNLKHVKHIRIMSFWYILFSIMTVPIICHIREREKYLRNSRISLYYDNFVDYSIKCCII